MFVFQPITDEEWKHIKSSKHVYSFVKDSKEYTLLELEVDSVYLSLRQPTETTVWLYIATSELKVACSSKQQVEVIPLKQGIEEKFFSALRQQVADSHQVSWECLVMETVIHVSINYREQQCLDRLFVDKKTINKVAGYSQLEHIQGMIGDLIQVQNELETIRETLTHIKNSWSAAPSPIHCSSNETICQYLYQRNGISDGLFCCLQRILLFENRIHQAKSLLLLEEQEMVADIKGRTDQVLTVDIAGVFFSAVFSGILMIPAFFAFNMLIPIEHLKNGSTHYFIVVVVACFIAIFIMAIIYAKWLKKNQQMRLDYIQSCGGWLVGAAQQSPQESN